MSKPKYITVSLIIIWCLLPVALLLLFSFAMFWVYPNILQQKFTTNNWAIFLFKSDVLQQSFFTSLLLATTVALLATFLGFTTSKWIAYHKNKKALIHFAYNPFALCSCLLVLPPIILLWFNKKFILNQSR